MPSEIIATSKAPLPAYMARGQFMRPPLKWPGGKRWQIPYLRPLWQPHSHRRLVEPFCGGLAVSLGLSPSQALLNDANPHLVNFYQQLRNGFEITMPMRNSKSQFAAYRARFNAMVRSGKTNSAEGAALFYYLNRTAFNGLCRFNRNGEFNAPFGQYNRINYTRDFSAYQRTLCDWKFVQGDFSDLKVEPDDFIYADPPYDVEFTQYSRNGFGWGDQLRVAEWLARHPGPVVLSNQATSRIVSLYRRLGFRLRFLNAPRRISCNGDRTPAKEVLALRNL